MHPPPPGARHRLRVGLLGGSFNPAHAGHRRISLAAIAALRLDQCWWLVSPQNPLKSSAGMAPFAARIAAARRLAAHPKIRISDLEHRLGTRYSVDTVRRLRRAYPNIRFVWLLGADNWRQLPAWRQWRRFMAAMPVAILDRPSYSYGALAGRASQAYRRRRRNAGPALIGRSPPVWGYVWGPRVRLSSTAIRARAVEAAGDGPVRPAKRSVAS